MAAQSAPWVPVLQKQIGGKEKDQDFTSEPSRYIKETHRGLSTQTNASAYALATLDPEGLPKVRHVIHRILTPSSNLLVTTTDTRMQKPVHLASHHTVEIAWWIEKPAVQFRITGQAYTIPNDPSGDGYKSKIEEALKGLKASGEEGKAEYWERERKRLWKEAMSGHLRASFARPAPGTPLDQCSDPETWAERLDAESVRTGERFTEPSESVKRLELTEQDDPEEQKKIEEAYSHFSLLAVRPSAFEFLELKPTPNTRTQWREGKNGEWTETKVAP